VVLVVVWDAEEVGLMLLGLILKMLDYQLDGYTIHQIGVSLIVWLHVIIIQLENLSLVVLLSQHRNVRSHVLLVTQHNIKRIFIMRKKFMPFQRMLLKFKQKL
jgi:hypothetical protein